MDAPTDGYDPNKSKLSTDTIAAFISSPITIHLTQVPGLGPVGAKLLNKHGVETTYQLVGVFLSFKGPETDIRQHCDLFWLWLQEKGVKWHRSAIVMCIAEKVNTMFPGIYDASAFAE